MIDCYQMKKSKKYNVTNEMSKLFQITMNKIEYEGIIFDLDKLNVNITNMRYKSMKKNNIKKTNERTRY